MREIKYKHLAAWDQMMGSQPYWCAGTQLRAAETNAPIDAIYEHHDAKGTWATYDECQSVSTCERIMSIFEQRGWGQP